MKHPARLILKAGVDVRGVRPEIVLALQVLAGVFGANDQETITVTSVVDGRHSFTSLHYAGAAVDIRSRGIPPLVQRTITKEANDALGPDFDFILERDHFHCEWQPRHRG